MIKAQRGSLFLQMTLNFYLFQRSSCFSPVFKEMRDNAFKYKPKLGFLHCTLCRRGKKRLSECNCRPPVCARVNCGVVTIIGVLMTLNGK